MKKFQGIIFSIFGVIFVLGLIWFLQNINKNQNNESIASGGALSAENAFFDFGAISMAAGKVSHIFKIKNTGAEQLIIYKIYTSCMCTEAFFIKGDIKKGPFGMPGHGGGNSRLKQVLAPNEEAVLEVIFDPAAHGPASIGLVEREVYIESSGGKLTLKIKANAAP
jgi:hypothetical protein